MCVNELKLVSVPEMNYHAKDWKGEILIRGSTITPGYFRNPEETKKTIDEDGWLHTGDVGMITPNGALKIIDRIKHIFKLQQGEWIAPEKLESKYVHHPLVEQIFVYGDSYKTQLVALVHLHKANAISWFKEKLSLGEEDEVDLTDPDNLKKIWVHLLKELD